MARATGRHTRPRGWWRSDEMLPMVSWWRGEIVAEAWHSNQGEWIYRCPTSRAPADARSRYRTGARSLRCTGAR
eukprot:scaffold56560_cov50-Phaeocystis_antarctica.AAC.1